jgi:predicted amidophosphoribosyltransferase
VFPYVLQKKRLLYLWKVANNRNLVYFFAEITNNILCEKYKNIPVVPVPPRPGKIKTKGWDQIDDLVMILEKKYKIQVLRLLERSGTLQQKKLNKNQRLITSKENYKAKNDLPANLIPKEVVLIDDVITTGATLTVCEEALKKIGVDKIHGYSLFSVP